MPEHAKRYERIIFPPKEIKEVEQIILSFLDGKDQVVTRCKLTIELASGDRYNYDENEEELFFSEYIKGFEYAYYLKDYNLGELRVAFEVINLASKYSEVSVSATNRGDLEKVFNYLGQIANNYLIPEPEPTIEIPIIFIGYGHNMQWRDLKDHLHERHGLQVECYEIDPRAGLTTKETLNSMLLKSSFAILVFTGEDQDAEGGLHARENVIHELGLFQGKLGWHKALVLLEDGVSEFSNIAGINQIRFDKGHIRETFGDVIATLKREFKHGW